MAFLIDATMKGYEFRGCTTGTSRKGNTFKSIRVESQEGRTAEISCTNPELFASVDAMRKASIYNFDVRAVSSTDRSYITLLKAPVLVTDYSEIDY